MILFINTSTIDLIQLKLIKNDKIVGEREHREPYKQSELLLGLIEKLLKQLKLTKNDLRWMAVVTGPGAFSALRFGVTTANALAWSLNIPIIDLSLEESETDKKVVKFLEEIINKQSLSNHNQFKSVVPKYGKEANITKSKNN